AGPKDILTSIQEGKIAGTKVLENLGLAKKPDMNVAILGDGPQAGMVAKAVAAHGYQVYSFAGTKSTSPKLLAVDGTIGNFSIYYEDKGKKKLTCGAIIAAPEPCSSPNAGKGDFQTAMDLNTFTKIAPKDSPEKSLILLDYFGPEHKSSARQALTAAMAAGKAGKEITIVMNKMLVHKALGQRLYDQARKSGIRFLRFNTVDDIKVKAQKKGFHVSLKEATLPDLELALECDCLVLPESCARENFETIAKFLSTPLDRENFLQPANVRHRLTQSPKKGIFFAGTCHDEVDAHDLGEEIQEILSDLGTRAPKETGIKINKEDCAKCLTCYRICPHGAIILDKKMQPQIMEDACFSCYLCVSNCPAHAIESAGFTNDQLANQVEDRVEGQVVIFACERSAALAADKIVLPERTQLISIPCACRISSEMILKSLIKGASKVIVSGCHEGNCRSLEGSTTARSGVGAIGKMPGITRKNITWEPVAANETHKFQRIISKAQKG
ncbi:MAG: hydrogenase iron-sulfur subunit, partial [Desulfobacteraceae bacterium]|nr:hydrogenase iron-sulfur subunit [Desulfobacteraceae bacterium]